MAFQNPQGGMVCQRQIAGWAGKDVATVRTEQKGVKPAPVEKQERLLPLRQRLPERFDKCMREQRRPALFVPLSPHIDHLDAGQGAVVHAGGECEVAVPAAFGLKKGLDPGRCRTKDHCGPRQSSTDQGHIPRVIPQAVVLLVGGVVFLIHDDQP
jgi:hypothetical protein